MTAGAPPAAPALDVPVGLEALADVFLEKARVEPMECVDLQGRHWLLVYRDVPEAQVAVMPLERRTVLPGLAEVTAHDLAVLLAWGIEPRLRTPLQAVPDRVFRLLSLDHPLAAAVRASRADVLPLRLHAVPEGFAAEAARAGLACYIADHRRSQGDSLLPLVLWAYSSRGVWPPMRQAIPPGDLLGRLVHDAAAPRQVEELALALKRLARTPASQLWSAQELHELREILQGFSLALPPVELREVERDGGVAVTWRSDRLDVAMPPLDRMSPAEVEVAARMLRGYVHDAVIDGWLRHGGDDGGTTAMLAAAPGSSRPGHPTTRRSAAAPPEAARSTDAGPAALAGDPRLAVTPAEVGRAMATPAVQAAAPARASIASTRREPFVLATPAHAGRAIDATTALPVAPGRRGVGQQTLTTTAADATGVPSVGQGGERPSISLADSGPASHAVSPEVAGGRLDVAAPTDLRAWLETAGPVPATKTSAWDRIPGGLAAWTFAGGCLLGFVVGFWAGGGGEPTPPRERPTLAVPLAAAVTAVADDGGPAPAEDPAAVPDEPRAPAEAADRAAPAPPGPPPDAGADAGQATAPAAPASPPLAKQAALPVGPGFVALPWIALWDGSNAPWAEPGTQATCNAWGDVELVRRGQRKVLICGPFYKEDGHLIRFATCAQGPARCVDVRVDRAGTKRQLCTPRTGRPLVRAAADGKDSDRYTSNIETRRVWEAAQRVPPTPCPGPAEYWGRMEGRWMNAGPAADAGPPPGSGR